MANSGTVGPTDLVVYTQYNNLRKDAVDITTGHGHTGATDDGKKLSGSCLGSVNADSITCPKVRNIMFTMGTPQIEASGYAGNMFSGTTDTSHYTVMLCHPETYGTPATISVFVQPIANAGTVVFKTTYCHAGTAWLSGHETLKGTVYVDGSGGAVGVSTISLTAPSQLGTFSAGEPVIVIITRCGTSDAGDTCTDQVMACGARLQYTSNI